MDYTQYMPYLWPGVGILLTVILASVAWVMYNRRVVVGPVGPVGPVDEPESESQTNPEERQQSTEDNGDDMTSNTVPS